MDKIEIVLRILREIFELDLLHNQKLNRLEIYTIISLNVVKKLITCVTKASRKNIMNKQQQV